MSISTLVAELATNPPASLMDARTRLYDLLATLRLSIEETLATARNEAPDYQALLSAASIRAEAVDAVAVAITEVIKAENASATALARVLKKLYAPHLEARVWSKLRPAATVLET